MALIDFEGWDLFGNFGAEFAGKFDSVSSTANSTVVSGRGEEGKALRLEGNPTVQRTLPSAIAMGGTLILGFGFKTTHVSTYDRFLLIRNVGGTVIGAIGMSAEGNFEYRSGNFSSTGLILTSTITFPVNDWCYLELKIQLSATATGSATFRVNGVDAGSVSGVATVSSATSGVAGLQFKGAQAVNNRYCYFDDLYVCDGTGARHNDFLGPRRVLTRPAESTVVNTMPTLVGAASAHAAVREIGPDEDTSYIASDVAGHRALFGHAGVTVDEVNAVRTVIRVRKEAIGARAIRSLLKSGATEMQGTTVIPGTAAYQYAQGSVREIDPATGAPWSVAGANAVQFGAELL